MHAFVYSTETHNENDQSTNVKSNNYIATRILYFIPINIVSTQKINTYNPAETCTICVWWRISKFHMLAVFDFNTRINHQWPWLSYNTFASLRKQNKHAYICSSYERVALIVKMEWNHCCCEKAKFITKLWNDSSDNIPYSVLLSMRPKLLYMCETYLVKWLLKIILFEIYPSNCDNPD